MKAYDPKCRLLCPKLVSPQRLSADMQSLSRYMLSGTVVRTKWKTLQS